MKDNTNLSVYFKIALATFLFLFFFLWRNEVSTAARSMSAYIILCYILCTADAHFRSIDVLEYNEKWLYYLLLGFPVLYFFFIILFRAASHEDYSAYIATYSHFENAARTIASGIGKTESSLIALDKLERIPEVLHNYTFSVYWSILTFFLMLSHSLVLSSAQKKFSIRHEDDEPIPLHMAYFLYFILLIIVALCVFSFQASLVVSENCTAKCGGLESSDFGFLFLHNMGFILSLACFYKLKRASIEQYRQSHKNGVRK